MPFREMRRAIEVWLTAVLSEAEEGLVGPIVPVAVTWARCEVSAGFHQAKRDLLARRKYATHGLAGHQSRGGNKGGSEHVDGLGRGSAPVPCRIAIVPVFNMAKPPNSPSVWLVSVRGMQRDCRVIEIGEKKHGQPEITTDKSRDLGGAAAAQRKQSPRGEGEGESDRSL